MNNGSNFADIALDVLNRYRHQGNLTNYAHVLRYMANNPDVFRRTTEVPASRRLVTACKYTAVECVIYFGPGGCNSFFILVFIFTFLKEESNTLRKQHVVLELKNIFFFTHISC